jgi:hypothetical protein
MRVIWCKNLEDIVNIGRGFGWIFHIEKESKHYYYIYAPIDHEVICLAIRSDEPVVARYTAIDDDGKIKFSNTPIMPVSVKIVDVDEDETFEEILKKRK